MKIHVKRTILPRARRMLVMSNFENQVVGLVTEMEKNEIQNLFEKRLALENLAKILDPEQNPNMYKRLIDDYASTNHAFNLWWKTQKDKYEWGDGDFYIDFDTAEIHRKL